MGDPQQPDKPARLIDPVRAHPFQVVLFDELEKAHPDVAAILLQILDDGRVTDAKGRTIDFRHALIVLTTNLQDEEVALALRTELLDRIDEIVRFQDLGLPQIEAIVTIHVDALAERLGARNVVLNLSHEAKLYLARVSMAAGSGARYVQRTVSHYVSTPLSTALLRGDLRDGSAATVTLEGDALRVQAA
jgi:ATP-dependent Clp protease ATP-binding subunit ClpB